MTEERKPAAGQRPPPREPDAPAIGDWLHIERDGMVVVYTGKAEMGQNIRTSLAQAVAEELRLPVEAIQLVMADTARTPFDMGTFGSRTTPTMAPRLHTVAAAARELLLDLAEEYWDVMRDELTTAAGQIYHGPTGRSIGFGELTQGQRLTQIYDPDTPVTPAQEWRIVGSSVPKVDARAIVTGQRRYTPDLTLPGMLVGKLLRPPAFGARLTALDTSAAALPGVAIIHDGDFIGIAAPDQLTATRALAAIQAEWEFTPQIATRELFAYLKDYPAAPADDQRFASPPPYALGSLAAGRAQASQSLAQTYTVAYIAHAPLEPRAALAQWHDQKLTVWTGTQRPFGVRDELALAFGLPEDAVRVIVPDTGSAYGGKHTGEVAIEAARLARGAEQAVKLIWTREEEFTWAYFRPAGVIDVASAVRADGALTAWEFHNYNSGAVGLTTSYDVANQWVEFHQTLAPLRQGSYRALAATANTFARETHMDELAAALGIEPLTFRLKNLRDARLRAVFAAAAERFGWGQTMLAPNHGIGIAGGTEKGSYVATCAEVAVDQATGQVLVVRVVQAFECGAIVNPEGLRNQVEGAIIQGLGGALFEAIEFADGRISTNCFSRYRVPRFADIPAIETVLLDRKDLPSAGAGETPIIGIAPAIGNAIFDATGVRLRSLPLAPDGRVEIGD